MRAKTVEAFINSCVIIVGVPLNLLVLVTQYMSNRMQGYSTPAMYMTNLCTANLLTVLVLPYVMMNNYGYMYGSLSGCKFAALMYYCCCTAGFATLGIISMDRYRVITKKHSTGLRSYRQAYVVLTVIWISGLMCASPALLYANVVIRDNSTNQSEFSHASCAIFFEYDQVKTALAAFKIMTCILWGIMPVLIMTWFYAFFYKRLRRVSYKRRSRTLLFVCVLLISFLVLQTPFVGVMIFDSYAVLSWDITCNNTNYRDAVTTIARVTPNFHCLMNPLLYAFLGNDFVAKFRQCLSGELTNRRAFVRAQQKRSAALASQTETNI